MARALIFLNFLIILSVKHLALAQGENHFIYKGFHDQTNLTLDGNAVIHHPSGLMQLTNTSKQLIGHAFYRFPLKFNSSSSGLRKDLSFSTNFVIAMVPEFPNTTTSGHGIAFVISPSMDFSGAVASQYLGLFNISSNGLPSNHVLAVEFDTIKSPEFRDIDDDHVGIDINSLISNASTPVTYYSEGKNVSLKLINGHPIQVWIVYNEVEQLLNVSVAPTDKPKPTVPLLSAPIDLSSILLDDMYVGFSSATGAIASSHYVLGWSFNKSGPAQSLNISELPLVPQGENHFIYKGFHDQANMQLDGNAVIHPSGLLQLTNTSKQVTGHGFYRFPLKFNTSSSGWLKDLSFSTNFVIAMVPKFPNTTTSGHGIAFFISPSMDFSRAGESQYLGLFNKSNDGLSSNHVLAVELDTIKSPEFGDIDGNHVGIDLNGATSNVSAPVTYYSEGQNVSLNLTNGYPIQVWIEYDEVEMLLNVTVAPADIPKPSLPLLSTPIDLSLILVDFMYVGFSSATGAIASNHYVLGWSFNKSGQAQSLNISELPTFPQNSTKANGLNLKILIIPIVTVAVLGIMVGMVAYFIRRKRSKETREDWEQEYGPQRFSYKDLYKATKGFKNSELLGSGGFGNVYRGVLSPSNEQVAVKRISNSSEQGFKEFVSEIVTMGRVRHRNLVQLLGYCKRRKELLLVYDYMPNGSLDMFLFTNEKPNLTWDQRFRILKDVASALLYLHEECEQVILHRDVKASNVMLDADMNGRLGDFGLARLYDRGAKPQATLVVGTVGYLAPELARTGEATASSDVFAFGALMLETACGRKPIEPQRLPEERVLVDWVFQSLQRGVILEASDPKLDNDYVVKEMELVLKLGLLCSHSNPVVRPSVRQVMQYLSGDFNVSETPPESAGIAMFLTSNEITADLTLSIPLSFENASNQSWSAITMDSILYSGR